MKNILLFMLLALSGTAEAQIVNIPDPGFKYSLIDAYAKSSAGTVIVIDANEDGEIQLVEAQAVWEMQIYGSPEDEPIMSITGLEAFTNLRQLEFQDITTLDSFQMPALANLEELTLTLMYNITSINIAGLTGLRTFKTDFVGSQTNPVTHLDITGLNNLERLHLHDFYYNVNSMEISDLQGLKELWIDGLVMADQLIVHDLPLLEDFKFDFTGYTQLHISAVPALVNFFSQLVQEGSVIDLSSANSLDTFFIEGFFPNTYLNLKNGKTTYSEFEILQGYSAYICIDEGEESYLAEAIEDGANVNTHCTYMPGGDYNTIAGTLTFDGDNNGCTGTDPFNSYVQMHIDNGTESWSSYCGSEGTYELFTQATGSYVITPIFANNWFTATPASATINMPVIDNSTTIQNFCITPNGNHPDVEVLISSAITAQPGFDALYRIVYRNRGNQVLSGDVHVSYDDARTDFVSATPAQDAAGTGTLSWGYAGLQPFESRVIYFTLNVNGPMETPAVNIDDVLPFHASVTPTAGDETPANNHHYYDEFVVGSFDPNDISCLEGSAVEEDMVGEHLHYNINFENEGTAPATFIVVEQEINAEDFDISTLELLYASHDIKVTVEGNKVVYRFDDIDLGPLEKGNILFKIKTQGTLEVGDSVMNKANIFFDYNWPIATNEAVTSITTLGTGDFAKDASVKLFPNPAKDIINITADGTVTSLQLYDVQGRLLQASVVNASSAQINMAKRAAGVYFVKVTTDKGVNVQKVVKN